MGDENKKNIKVFFISVDPERDTPEVVKNYLSNLMRYLYLFDY